MCFISGSSVGVVAPETSFASRSSWVRAAMSCIEEYISTAQFGRQILHNRTLAELICEFLGTDLLDRKWAEPQFCTDVSDLVDNSLNGGSLLS